MPRVVPSQVVALIDDMFHFARAQSSGQIIELAASHSPRVAALVNVVEQIPSELLVMDGHAFALYVASIAALKDALGKWQSVQANYRLINVAGPGVLKHVTHDSRA